jgi:hypothetical protein
VEIIPQRQTSTPVIPRLDRLAAFKYHSGNLSMTAECESGVVMDELNKQLTEMARRFNPKMTDLAVKRIGQAKAKRQQELPKKLADLHWPYILRFREAKMEKDCAVIQSEFIEEAVKIIFGG